MIFLAIATCLLLAAIVVREFQQSAEGRTRTEALEQMRNQLQQVCVELLKAREEAYIVRKALTERKLLTEKDLARVRQRVIDKPRQRKKQRSQLLQEFAIPEDTLILDDGESIH